MGEKYFAVFLVLCAVIALGQARCYSSSTSSSGTSIRNKANSYVGSTSWSYASSRKTGRNTNKCNIFVAEVIEGAGASVPHRRWWKWSPIGAREWEQSGSSYLTSDSCWNLVTGCYKKGDVAALGGHVGIVTGRSQTTSAAHDNVRQNDWGFRSGQSPTFWRYTC